MSEEFQSVEERRDFGRSRREEVPRSSHAEWSRVGSHPDPVQLIEEQNEGRIQYLVPVRRVRMARSPFTFYRGSARIMASDLARTRTTGIATQICGDAHLANFGAYASPERRLVFDLNDFDETLRGPWEWDVKRLAASFTIAGRHNGLTYEETRKVTRRVVSTYRKAMRLLAEMRPIDIWYSLVEADEILESVDERNKRKRAARALNRVKRKDSLHVLDKLAEEVDGRYRIRSEPPLIVPIRDLPDQAAVVAAGESAQNAFDDYLETLPDNVGHLLKEYRPVDLALKVVGVGSVGTACSILLLEGRDRHDPLFLQIKQANKSVLEEFLGPSPYENAGQRVVEGQGLMQTVSDIFLGWTRADATGNHYYLRQLKDWKASSDVDDATRKQLDAYARVRGWTLARAHARSGDPIAIAGYLGRGKSFDRALVEFSETYADQNQLDYEAFVGEIQNGRLEAAELI